MKLKIVFSLFLIFSFSIFSFAINLNSYKKLTDRDRILLSMSYYEVAEQYKKIGKQELANSYYDLASKIEKDVKKYITGELTVPQKSIKIDWNSIYSDDTTTDNNVSEDSNKNQDDKSNKSNEEVRVRDDKKDTLVTKKDGEKERDNYNKEGKESKFDDLGVINENVNGFINSLILKDAVTASDFFSNQILIENENLYITKEELKETIGGWFETAKDISSDYLTAIDKKSEKSYEVSIKFQKEINFFVSLNNGVLVLKTTNNGNKFLFDTIVNFKTKDKNTKLSNIQSSEDSVNMTPKSFLPTMTANILVNNLEKAIRFFDKDVWFEEYKVTISNDNILQYINEWKKQYPNIKSESDVIKLESIKEFNDNTLFKESKLDLSGFYMVSAEFQTDPIVPGNTNKNIYVFVLEKTNLDPPYRIVAIAQTDR